MPKIKYLDKISLLEIKLYDDIFIRYFYFKLTYEADIYFIYVFSSIKKK